MISNKDTLCFDIDGTICSLLEPEELYSEVKPFQDMIDIINKLYYNDYHIILHTARGMRTHAGDIGNINRFVKPILEEWLLKHNVKYHELVMGKPWGSNVVYVDDNAYQPEQFMKTMAKILPLLKEPK